MKLTTAIFAAVTIIISGSAFAQPVHRGQPECAATGSGMDPRCTGHTTPGTVTDATTAKQQGALRQGARPAAIAAPRDRKVIIERR